MATQFLQNLEFSPLAFVLISLPGCAEIELQSPFA